MSSIYSIPYPIVHKPSFNTLTATPILLLSMIMIGACFSKCYGSVLQDSVGFSNEIGHHLRWLIFQAREIGASEPWELQSLLILEVFEKHYSTRALHERSGVHQAVKIEMMKRSTLLGGDPYATESKADIELNEVSDGKLLLNKWIHAESMKRCALMAFIFDLNSTVTSGHQSTLFVNKLRLGLPCDDAIWEADLDELKNIELPRNPQMVLTELKRLLKGEKVETTSFGKKVILFAIVSLMIQLENKDETNSMIAENSRQDILRDSWRDKISYALDSWKFSVAEGFCCDINNLLIDLRVRKESQVSRYFDLNDTKCKFPSYHMAQIRLRVVNHDMLIYAGVPFRMSVKVDLKDYESAMYRLKALTESLDGRVSIVHAFMCLGECLLDHQTKKLGYEPQKDPIHERAHVVIDSLMIVWCYVFLKRGTESSVYGTGESYQEEAHEYLSRVELELYEEQKHINTALDYHIAIKRCAMKLETIENLNNIASLVSAVSELYAKCFWELGREYSRLLVHMKERSLGKADIFCRNMYE